MKACDIDYKNLAVNPEIISKIANIDPESNNCFSDIDKFLRADQSATTLILRVANSPIYNRGNQIRTLPIAINTLGVSVIRSLILLALSRSVFTQSKDNLMIKHVWHHSLLTGIASQAICSTLGESKDEEEAFIAGLLHDIGKVLLFAHYKDQYIEALDYAIKNNCSSADAEKKLLNINHFEVGQHAVKVWKLPDRFSAYIGVNLDEFKNGSLMDKVQHCLAIANILVKGAGIGSNSLAHEIKKTKLNKLGVSEDLCDHFLEETFMQQLMANEIYQQCL